MPNLGLAAAEPSLGCSRLRGLMADPFLNAALEMKASCLRSRLPRDAV